MILKILYYAMHAYFVVMVISCILSWIPSLYPTKFYQIIRKITGFYLDRFHGLLVFGNIDFTPTLGLIIYQVALNMLALIINRFVYGL